MNVRSASILFAGLLSIVTLTSAPAWANASAGPMTPAVATSSTPAWAVAPCAANLTSGSPVFPSTAPKPVPMDTVVCGSCSVPACRGVTYNSFCGSPLHPSSCVAALGGDCSEGVPQCQCWELGRPYP